MSSKDFKEKLDQLPTRLKLTLCFDLFRFVLEHKIEELRQQILPKEGVIMDLRSQIDAMEDELVSWSGILEQ